ncbi:MAG: N-6 DNA methylase [Urechidicola sp.]|nr:N-6 DNA methylase [Urechidicola sp.]
MPIFQKSVIKKHLENLDQEKVEKAFQTFRLNYNSAKIEQIKTLKEEEYQDGFLREIFVDVLDYTLRPNENYDLQREFKNQTDGKKADGAILKDENAIAVIELKSTKTKDLTKITQQAFNYKNNQPECKYVITSNFQKIRFYIDYSTEFEEFDLFFLDRERFELLYLILHKESIFSNLPIKLKKETQFHEKEISEELYKDYSHFKSKLFNNLIENHPENDKLLLFKKSQKLLDRFLFILFAEDSGLLPPNSISRIIKRFDILKEEDAYKPIYEIFRQYFGYMNIGREGKKEADNIPAYNGGLFYEDLLLNNLNIDDEILIDDLKKLSTYNFNTEVDVNILGHIFEHSLNEIEEVTAKIEGTVSDQKRTKRKKDGVFYTPKYITTYIVANTIGKLCIDKRKELDIEEIEYDDSFLKKDGTLSVKGKKLFKTLTDYKNWLTNLKIIDPACGSGAFLNQALNYLIEEHEKIDDIIADLTNSPLRLFDTDKNILENNLFGVDINEESVEIAQLSLWLRTAKKDRKLSKLNNNIKCGNSLLKSEFDWHKEFPSIMKNGGFDVVIGNPPYIKEATNKSAFNGLHEHSCYQGKMDLWYFFGALALDIIKKDYGLIGYIAPNNWITNDGASKFRDYIVEKGKIVEFIDFSDFKVFDSAGIQTMIYIMKRTDDNSNYGLNFSKVINSKIKHEDAQLFLEKIVDEKYEYFISNIKKEELKNQPINFINAELNLIIEKIKSKESFNLDSKEIASGIDLLQDFVNKKHGSR